MPETGVGVVTHAMHVMRLIAELASRGLLEM